MLKVHLKRKLVILMVVSLERTLKIRVEHYLQFFNYRDPRNIIHLMSAREGNS